MPPDGYACLECGGTFIAYWVLRVHQTQEHGKPPLRWEPLKQSAPVLSEKEVDCLNRYVKTCPEWLESYG